MATQRCKVKEHRSNATNSERTQAGVYQKKDCLPNGLVIPKMNRGRKKVYITNVTGLEEYDFDYTGCKFDTEEEKARYNLAFKELNLLQRNFVKEYFRCNGCILDAIESAGFSRKSSSVAYKMLKDPRIKEAMIQEEMAIDREKNRDIASLAEIQMIRTQMIRGEIKDDLGFSPEMKDRLSAGKDLEKYILLEEEKRVRIEAEEKAKTLMSWTIPITDITTDFVEMYRDIHDAFSGNIKLREIVCKGGRGSIKSSIWSAIVYETIRQDKDAHVVYTRRFKIDLRGSVYNQFMKTVIRYNDLENWEFKQSPMCAIYKPTGQMVMFVGADKPISLKSFNVPFGYVKLLIHEECDEMAGLEQMDSIEDTFLRSDTVAIDVKIFNPPKSKNNFMNAYAEECKKKPTTRVYHSYYYNVPIKWLGQRFFDRANWFKEHKNLYYRNNYLGEVTGTGGGIFDNIEVRNMDNKFVDGFRYYLYGLDFGFEHPQTFVISYYDEDNDIVYCFNEVYSKHCKNSSFARKIKDFMDVEIIADSARPDAIREMQDWGFNVIGAKKRWSHNKGRDYCWEWLQQTTKIVIDPDRCPHLYEELSTLEHEQLADGSFSDAYPKVGEDCVMALIYSLNKVIMESRRNAGLYDDCSLNEDDYEDEELPSGLGE